MAIGKIILLLLLLMFCSKEEIKKENSKKIVSLGTTNKFRMECFLKAEGWEFLTLRSIESLAGLDAIPPIDFDQYKSGYIGVINELSLYYWNPEKLQEGGMYAEVLFSRLPHKGRIKKKPILRVGDRVISINNCMIIDMIDVFDWGMNTSPLGKEGFITLFDYIILNDEKDVRKNISSVTLIRNGKAITMKF